MSELEENERVLLEYLEKVGPKCKSLMTMIETAIEKAMKNPAPNPGGYSNSYLEAQNAELLKLLLKREMMPSSGPGSPMDPPPPKPSGEGAPGNPPPKDPADPPKVPQKTGLFWR